MVCKRHGYDVFINAMKEQLERVRMYKVMPRPLPSPSLAAMYIFLKVSEGFDELLIPALHPYSRSPVIIAVTPHHSRLSR